MSEAELSVDLPGGGHVLFTARAHGNLSSVGGVDAEHGLHARERLRGQIDVEHLLRGYQVHGTTVQLVRGPARKSERGGEIKHGSGADTELTCDLPPDSTAQPSVEADGQATNLRGLGAIVLAADCLLLAAGVSEVRDVAACTICDERFFSHRREGARAGRQGAVAWLS